MTRVRVIVHVAEPFDFARANGGSADLAGWTAQGSPAHADWVIHLDCPARIGEEAFDKVRVTSRYAGETVARAFDGVFTAVTISWPRRDGDGHAYWHHGMVGNVSVEEERG